MKGKSVYLQRQCSEHQRAESAERGAWHLHSSRPALWWWHQALTLCKLLCWCCYSSHSSAPAAQLLPCCSNSLTFQQSALSTLLPLFLDAFFALLLGNLHIIGFLPCSSHHFPSCSVNFQSHPPLNSLWPSFCHHCDAAVFRIYASQLCIPQWPGLLQFIYQHF